MRSGYTKDYLKSLRTHRTRDAVDCLNSVVNFAITLMPQLSFSDVEFDAKRKQTRRDKFLAEMDEVVPWARLTALIEPVYPQSQSRLSCICA